MASGGTSLPDQGALRLGLGNSARALAQVLTAAGIGGKEGLQDGAVVVVNRIRRLLSTPGRGRVYRIPGQKTLHRASAPGDPPAVLFGRLRSSYTWSSGSDSRGPYVEIGTNLEKAPFLEFGTRRMRPRPHFRPAVDDTTGEIAAAVAAGIIVAQKGAARRLPTEIGLGR